VAIAASGGPHRGRSRVRRHTRNGLTVAFPVLTAASTAVAAVNHGQVRGYVTLVAIGATLSTAYLGMRKDRRTDAAALTASEAREIVGKAFARSSQPLVTLLAEIAAASTVDQRRPKIETLISRVLSIAQAECGRSLGQKCNVRTAYYRLSADRQRLSRHAYEGWRGDVPPREEFRAVQSDLDKSVLALANSEQVRLVANLDEVPQLAGNDRSYKSFIAVPVRAGQTPYGLMCVDSDKAYSLTEIDKLYMILFAGIIAAAVAQLADDVQTRTQHTEGTNTNGAVDVPSPRKEPVADVAVDQTDDDNR
jgi:putative methionine-R-sulfoxide reductase with GAF domain